MENDDRSPVTRVIADLLGSDERAADRAFVILYDELRQIARRRFRAESAFHTLTPTALVHEAYVRLASYDALRGYDRERLLAAASRVMREVLIDHVRRQRAEKRGGGFARITFTESLPDTAPSALDFEALHEALSRLEQRSPRMCRVIELRFFAGMSIDETASVLGVSDRTVRDDWTVARMWLARELRS